MSVRIPAPSFVNVTIPEEITVHLGAPDEMAENVTLPFIDYVKNVASSELYPTWPENAIRANVYAIVSIALNRVFTEWYRGRGYNFDITNSTQFDQTFVPGRGIFNNISTIVDELFDDYIVRQTRIEPLFAQYCDGRISQCEGMYQWGSVDLANSGYSPYEILQYYYGNDIEIATNAPVASIEGTYPGTPLKAGDSGINIYALQLILNDISVNYPAIPKIIPIDGVFSPNMEAAVKAFQTVFKLPPTGIVDKGTWYRIRNIYAAVRKLSQLISNGLFISEIPRGNFDDLGRLIVPRVQLVQYYLNILSTYYKTISAVDINGILDQATSDSIIEFQKIMGLRTTGLVDIPTWEKINSNLLEIFRTVLPEHLTLPKLGFPGIVYRRNAAGPGVVVIQEYLAYISTVNPNISYVPYYLIDGLFGPITESAVTTFQQEYGLKPDGIVEEITWDKIMNVYFDLKSKEQLGGK